MMSYLNTSSVIGLLLGAIISVSALAEPALWRVDAEGGRASAYLFGSVHFGTEAMYPLSDKVLKAFSESDVLAVELDADLIDENAIREVFKRYGQYSAGESLSEKLTKADWSRLLQASGTLELTEAQLDKVKPWMVAMRLTAHQIIKEGFDHKLGIDHYFLSLAKNSSFSTPVMQLETFEQQLSLIDGLPEAQQINFLLETLEKSKTGSELLTSIVKAWCGGDEEQLERLVLDTVQVIDSSLHEELFIERNNMMMEKISENLQAGQQLFVVVGAGHIVGEHGLRSMFSSQGFQVTRVQ